MQVTGFEKPDRSPVQQAERIISQHKKAQCMVTRKISHTCTIHIDTETFKQQGSYKYIGSRITSNDGISDTEVKI